MTFLVSDESINSHGYKVMTDGIDLHSFATNPVMLWNHNSDVVLGKWADIKSKEGKLYATPVFDMDDPEAMKIKSKVRKGFIKGSSIGIMVKDVDEIDGQLTIMSSELKEISITALPSNSNAVKLYSQIDNELCEIDILQLSLIAKNKKINMADEIKNLDKIKDELVNEEVVKLARTEPDPDEKKKKTIEERLSALEELSKKKDDEPNDDDEEEPDPKDKKEKKEKKESKDDDEEEPDPKDKKEKKEKKESIEAEIELSVVERASLALGITLNEDILENSNMVLLSIAKLKSINDDLSSQLKEIKEKELNLFIDEAVKSGKVPATQKQNLLKLAQGDLESLKSLISSLKGISLSAVITEKQKSVDNTRTSWDIREWEKKDPSGLKEMKLNFPDEYTRLFDDFYGKILNKK